MGKQKVMIFSGFLGSGKTTTMIQTAKYLKGRGVKIGLITNDLGSNLVDTNFAKMENIAVSEIPDGCFCHDVGMLADKMKKLQFDESPDLIFAEPVGSCVDLVRSVYMELQQNYREEFDLGPFTAVIDPGRYQSIYMGLGENTFNPQATYMYKKQLEEADILLLNKTDLLSQKERTDALESIRGLFPNATVIPISSAKQENYQEWVEAFTHGQKSAVIDLDIDWDYVQTAENTMGWYNKVMTLECRGGQTCDFNHFTRALMEKIKELFIAEGREIAHLKIIGTGGRDYCKAALTSAKNDIVFTRELQLPQKQLELNINIRALILPDHLLEIIEKALQQCLAEYNLDAREQKTQAFDSFGYAPEPLYQP